MSPPTSDLSPSQYPPRLYNTMTQRVEVFASPPHETGVYVCGITPYDTTHLGHAFSYVSYDALVRYLRYLGYPVRHVQNITDVDDDLLARARELDLPWQELAAQFIEVFDRDMTELNVQRPDVVARATEHIEKMQQIISTLLERGHGYVADGRVYYRCQSVPDYGRLSRYTRDQMLALGAERGGDPSDPRKEDPLDFLMWQPSRPGEPAWPSPWGPGRPGWHIECTAISLAHLGPTVALHGGGHDLVFPHHESERVQAEAYTRQPFVGTWMHNGMVRSNGEKMAKSRKNMVMVRTLLDRYPAVVLRWYLLRHHYREPFDYGEGEIRDAANEVALCQRAAALVEVGSYGPGPDLEPYRDWFLDALADDFDTPRALQALLDLARGITRSHEMGLDILPGRTALVELGEILGLQLATIP